jgi:TPR repeat protein
LGIITNKNYKNMKKIYLIMILFFATASGVFAQTANIVTLTLKAKSGEAEAQNALGEAYYDGKGVTENLTEAVKWFTKAAEQENAKAEYNLGNCYYYGNGVQYRDRGEAVKWYTKAAEQGYTEAQKVNIFVKNAPYFKHGTEWNAEKVEKLPIFAKKSAHNDQL